MVSATLDIELSEVAFYPTCLFSININVHNDNQKEKCEWEKTCGITTTSLNSEGFLPMLEVK